MFLSVEIGAASGDRTIRAPWPPVSYRIHVAIVADNATLAGTPCPILPDENQSPPNLARLGRALTYITKDDWPAVEETIQWLTEKQDSGYKMVDSNTRLWQMVEFMKGKHFPWGIARWSLSASAVTMATPRGQHSEQLGHGRNLVGLGIVGDLRRDSLS